MDTFEQRPWGTWRIILDTPETTVKVITIEPGQMLSLQSHQLRSETWHVVQGEVIVYCSGTDTVMMQPGTAWLGVDHTYHIPRNIKHRLINPSEHPAVIIETIKGVYDEEDIIRYQDSYGRA